MKNIVMLTFLVLIGIGGAFAQSKTAITSEIYEKWPHIEAYKISPNGNNVSYSVANLTSGETTLFLTNIKTGRKTHIPKMSARRSEFSENGRYYFVMSGDSLLIYNLLKDKFKILNNVSDHRISRIHGHQWSIVTLANREVNLWNLDNNAKISLIDVDYFESVHTGLIIGRREKKQTLYLHFNLLNKDPDTICRIDTIKNIIVDASRMKVAFFGAMRRTGDTNSGIIQLYDIKNNHLKGIRTDSLNLKGLTINKVSGFSKDGNRVFLELSPRKPDNHNDGIPLNIWHYKDVMLQSQQLRQDFNRSFKAVLDLFKLDIYQLENENSHVELNIDSDVDDKYFVSRENNGGDVSELWLEGNNLSYSLISTLSGKKILMPYRGILSPDCKFYVYFDPVLNNYISYDICQNIFINITKDIKTSWKSLTRSNTSDGLLQDYSGWVSKSKAVLLHDEYDIWLVSLSGNDMPFQLTKGRSTSTYFERIYSEYIPDVDVKEDIILSGFNLLTKENSFYKVKVEKGNTAIKLNSGNDRFFYSKKGATGLPPALSIAPIRAQNQEAYLVIEMKANSSPNLVYTKDFKEYIKVSEIHPEKNFNWYTSELHSWYSLDGSKLQGILYKPENFDENKKYPIIFHYYETLSDQLNCYIRPAPSSGSLNIAWYVSNGFLVFLPDIAFKIGDPFESTYNSVMGAIKYLKTLNYIDQSKMGLQGHSWGGAQTNYLLTRTNVFAAACSSSSMSNFVSGYNGLATGDHSAQPKFETGQYRVGFTLWDNPKWYFENSPVVNAEKISTPLLLFQTTNDEATRFEHALELFSSLRRLNKKCWLLEYTDGQHFVAGKSALDFDLRMQQFFNHLLKGKPAPLWMVEGRPAKLKGIDERLQLDTVGRVQSQ